MSRFIMPRQGVKGQNLNPADGAMLFFYTVGTTAFKDTFTDAAKSIAHTNPVAADGTGLFAYIELDGAYDVVLKDKNGVQLWGPETVQELIDYDNVLSTEETFTLSAGQTTITFSGMDANTAAFYVGSSSVDRGRLVKIVDYTVTNSTTIELINSFPAGTKLTGVSGLFVSTGVASVLNVTTTTSGTSIADHTVLTTDIHVLDSTNGNIYRFTTVNYSAEVTTDSNSGFYIAPTSESTGASGVWILVNGSLTADASVVVGSGEKFPTLNSLLVALENVTPGNNATMEATLKAGFVMAEQVLLYGINLGWLKISSVDSETTVARSAMTTNLGSVDSSIPTFGGISATLPIINVMFRMDTSGSPTARQDGLFVENGSATILSGAGFQDFTEVGIYANSGSRIMAQGANCSGSGVYGFFAFKGSSINCESATATGCTQYGLYVNRASQASANSSTFTTAGINAIRIIRGSTCSWEDGVGTDAVADGMYILNSVVQALRADVSDAGGVGIYSHDSSIVDFRDGVATGCAGVASIWAFRGSNIDANGATVTGSLSTTAAVLAQRASTINFQSGDCSGSTATYGIRCSEASTVNAQSANAQKGGAPAVGDCAVEFGGIINFDSGTGGVSITVNTLASQGIIFQ